MDDLQLRRARSFGSVAAEYERARPGYPEEAVDWLVGAEPRRVLDLAAGTGKLTRQLVARGHAVVAVEPSAEMLERLRGAVPAADALQGRAEAIPLPASSVDVVLAAQAFHWFDPPSALAEIARVLRPDGRLGLVWNVRDDSVPWVKRLSRAIGSESDRDGADPVELIAVSGLFAPAEQASFRYEHSLDRRSLEDLVRSRSYVATLGEDERAAVLGEVGAIYDEEAGAGGIVLPYVTEAFRAAVAGV